VLTHLLIDLRDLVLGFVLERHLDGGQLDIFEGIKVVIAVQRRLNVDGILWS
jgi:hypothetical protein